MHMIAHKLWIGSEADFNEIDAFGTSWHVVHAARDPWHREALGYTGRGAPKDHPEYLLARRGRRLLLNLVDADDPKYIGRHMIDEAMQFIEAALNECAPAECPDAVLICCNQAKSRAPTLGLLYLAPFLGPDFEEAVRQFLEKYPDYAPGRGMMEFARENWKHYHTLGWHIIGPEAHRDDALAKATQIWQAFCDALKTDPAAARDQLIESIVQALSAAPQQERLTHGTATASVRPPR